MDIFKVHSDILQKYEQYIRSFVHIKDKRIQEQVENELREGLLWPDPLVQFNPSFKMGKDIDALCANPKVDEGLSEIFKGFELYQHQVEAIELGVEGKDFVVTSGTGSGKSLTYIGTIFNHVLKNKSTDGKGVKALIVYPMNALINSQSEEFKKFKKSYEATHGKDCFPISFAQYTGQEAKEIRETIKEDPPDILLTNYMMLELIMTRLAEAPLRESMKDHLKFLVFDELHTYRGRQGSDVSMLIRRIKAHVDNRVTCIGTSATMVSGDSLVEQKTAVAEVASTIFGAEFSNDQIVFESLERQISDIRNPVSTQELRSSVAYPLMAQYDEEALRKYPLSKWLESEVVLEEIDGWLRRRKPMTMENIAEQLSDITRASKEQCEARILELLNWSKEINERLSEKNARRSYFAFRLHQFISQAGSVYVTLHDINQREIRLSPGHFIQQEDEKVRLYQTVFSRFSGHEFLCVRLDKDKGQILPRDFRETFDPDEEQSEWGYLFREHEGDDSFWSQEMFEMLPDSWVNRPKTKEPSVVKKYRHRVPQRIFYSVDGKYASDPALDLPEQGWFMPARLLFDPTSATFFDAQTRDHTKLMRLGNEGRSTATTILSYGIIASMHEAGEEEEIQKLLSFTDNRQDAALQAGHFNDFIGVGRLRSAIFHALQKESSNTLDSATIAEAVFDALRLRQDEYALQASKFPGPKKENEDALKDYLSIRILQDLRRGWKFTMPNLEQCALLQIQYKYLKEVVSEDSHWQEIDLFNRMTGKERFEVIQNVLDFFRTSYAIHHHLLAGNTYTLRNKIREKLKSPWTFSDQEEIELPNFIRTRTIGRTHGKVFTKSAGPGSGLGKYLKQVAKAYPDIVLKGETYTDIINGLFALLGEAGYLRGEVIRDEAGEATLWQLKTDIVSWVEGDETTVSQDAIRNRSFNTAIDPAPNEFFQEFYKQDFSAMKALEGREHTGQIGTVQRIEREDGFRAGEISALFCSPTMELGIDISDLSVVHMRNAPPNPANYAQRGGRAGRSGQGALVFTYCSQYSPHDRHYFENKKELVAGAVVPPKIDLSNKSLVTTHINALYLLDLGLHDIEKSVYELIQIDFQPEMPMKSSLQTKLKSENAERSERVFKQIKKTLGFGGIGDFTDDWLRMQIDGFRDGFDRALDRWRRIYRNAERMRDEAQAVFKNPIYTQKSKERRAAGANHAHALRQLDLLKATDTYSRSEFYPFSYLAAEGFLPGYNFNRLPLRTFIAGTRENDGEFISRPRQIAIREFGPRSVVYHNGGKYEVRQLNMTDIEAKLMPAKVARQSGYFLTGAEYTKSVCPVSGTALTNDDTREVYTDLLEMAETNTRRSERINCDEEERMSTGYKLQTYFSMPGGFEKSEPIVVKANDDELLRLYYMKAAKIYYVNNGWRRSTIEGFPIDMQTGYWQRKKALEEQDENDKTIRTVKLYTDITVDSLYIQPIKALNLDPEGIITLQYALKRAVEEVYQAEPREIDVIRMGSDNHPNIMVYESSEGSLGVMHQIALSSDEFRRVVSHAYALCHFEDGKDLRPELGPASYEDLLSYYNQRDHEVIDRYLIKEALERLMECEIEIAPKLHNSYEEQYQTLLHKMDGQSSTEDTFLKYLYKNKLRLPDIAQPSLKEEYGLYVQPDFQYGNNIYVFCDGTPHDDPDVKADDKKKRRAMRDVGLVPLVWHYATPIEQFVNKYPEIFTKVL